MRKFAWAIALAGVLGAGLALSGNAQAAPMSGIGDAAQTLNVVEKTQFVYGGYRHCWYANGWHGAGWYRCGYAWRRGLGWGGGVGWNGWAAPGVAVAVPGVAVTVGGPYFYNGRHWRNRAWRHGRWTYW